jgi:hypothetical protein
MAVPSASNAASNPKPKPGAAYTVQVTSPGTPTQPVAAPNGSPIQLDFRVTNTTTSFNSGFVIVEITAPVGFAVSAPTVDLEGWTATLTGQSVRAVAPQQSTGIKPGDAVTISLTAVNAISGTAVTPTTWPLAVSGPFGNPIAFALSGSPATVVALAQGFVAFAGKRGTPLVGLTAPSAAGTACVTSPTNPVCSTANLAQGALSNVYFGQRPCPATDATCTTGTEVELAGDFGNLYSNDAPAKVVLVCGPSECPYPTTPPSGAYDANYLCTSSCAGNGGPYNKRVVNIDFAAYPAFVQLKGATSFGQAPRCVPVSDLTTTGRITSPAAKATGYCVDVNAITRTGNAFGGDLVRPILFVEDPRMR